jgi:hypothetical protein
MKAMIRMTLYSLAPAALLAAMTFTVPQPAFADEQIIPIGLACPDFNVGLATTGGPVVEKDFNYKDGSVRSLSVGKGVVVTWTNEGTDPDNPVAGASVTIKTSGSVTSTRKISPDGTLATVTATGHNGLVLFPSDVPAGPTTTQYIGRIVYTIDLSTGVFTLLSTSGMERDICAELAS